VSNKAGVSQFHKTGVAVGIRSPGPVVHADGDSSMRSEADASTGRRTFQESSRKTQVLLTLQLIPLVDHAVLNALSMEAVPRDRYVLRIGLKLDRDVPITMPKLFNFIKSRGPFKVVVPEVRHEEAEFSIVAGLISEEVPIGIFDFHVIEAHGVFLIESLQGWGISLLDSS